MDISNGPDSFPYDNPPSKLYRLLLPNDTQVHGLMLPSVVSKMPWTSDFQVIDSPPTVQLNDRSAGKDTANVCNDAFETVVTKAIEDDMFEMLHQRRSEPYLIPGAKFFGHLQRFSHCLFGIVARGAHMTAYVRTENSMKIWVPRRAAHLFTYPGKLDSTVAGGVKATDSPLACILAESMEEASLPKELVQKKLHSVGTMTYMTTYDSPTGREKGLISPEILYLYDLELPEDVILKPQDDEVEQFYLMDVNQVTEALVHEEFKTNSAVVMIDFFIRHGLITAENEPNYVEIISRMHRRLPVATAPKEG
jgi:8-oxo-dGTP pyrophosphatase MutT (NUDIX family)